jgi:uncharacterized protein (TIGR02284 family)
LQAGDLVQKERLPERTLSINGLESKRPVAPRLLGRRMSISTSSSQKTLKNLVEILHDGQMGFAHAADNVKNPRLKELFSRFSLQRSKFAGELQSELLGLGEKDPEKVGGTASGALHRGWIELKSAFVHEDNHAILSEAERGEDVAKKAYRDALEEDLPAPLRESIGEQALAIEAAHDEVKALRDVMKH